MGASVTNALSEWLKVEVYRGTVFRMSFRSYEDPKTGKMLSGHPRRAPRKHKAKDGEERARSVHFKPDARVFDNVTFNFEAVSKRLKELAFLNKGLEIALFDERVPEGKSAVAVNYKFDGGLHDFAEYLNEGKTPLYQEADRLQDGAGRHPHRVCRSAHDGVHREHVLLRQQHPDPRGRLPRDGVPHGAHKEPERQHAI